MLSLRNKKVMLITDSLGLPRSTPVPVTDDETWVYRIMDNLGEHYRFRLFRHRGMDTTSLVYHLKKNVSAYQNADIVIIQVGVVDCYPRALSKDNLRRVKKLPGWVQKLIQNTINNNYKFFVELSDNRYVKPTKFIENINFIKNHFSNSKVFIIPIAPASKVFNEKNSKVENSIIEYNELYLRTFKKNFLGKIYRDSDKEKMVLSDGHHLSVSGHHEVFLSIKELLSNEKSTPRIEAN